MAFGRPVLVAALLSSASPGSSLQAVHQQQTKLLAHAENQNAWAAAVPVGLALALQLAMSDPAASVFDPLDFTSGPYVLPQQERINWDLEPKVPDPADFLNKPYVKEDPSSAIQSAASAAIAEKSLLDNVAQSSEVAPVVPQKKAATLALIGNVPDEGDFVPTSILSGRLGRREVDPVKNFPRRVQAPPVSPVVARAAASSSEVTSAPSKLQQQKTKTTMASVIGKERTKTRPSSYVPDEGQLVSPSVLSRKTMATTRQGDPPMLGPNRIKAAPVPSVVAKAAATSSEVSTAPPRSQQQKTKTTMASVVGKQENPTAARTPAKIVPDEGQLLTRSVLSRTAPRQQSAPVGPGRMKAPPVPSAVARAAATSSEVTAAPSKLEQQKTKTTMASVIGKKQKASASRRPAAFVPDEGQLLSPSFLSASSTSRSSLLDMEADEESFSSQPPLSSAAQARAAMMSSEVSPY